MTDLLTLEKIQQEQFENYSPMNGQTYSCPRCHEIWEYQDGEWAADRTAIMYHPARHNRTACYSCILNTPKLEDVTAFVDDLDEGYAKAVGGYLFGNTEQSTNGVDYQIHEDVYRHLLDTDEGFADYLKYEFIDEKRIEAEWQAFVLEAMN